MGIKRSNSGLNVWGSEIFLIVAHNNNERLFEGNQEK
jgi:hypothetical protein